MKVLKCMPKNKQKKKLNRKKKTQNTNTSPSGEITVGEIVKISDDQEQRKDNLNKNDSNDKSNEKNIHQEQA